MNKIALITGATAGIGKATSLLLAQHNYDLIITGRRHELLAELKNKILSDNNKVSVQTLPFDIRDNNAVVEAVNGLPDKWRKIDILVNNAGLSVGLNDINEGLFDDWERMIDTNIKGLLYITREVVPLMVKNKKGHIINISSIAGREVYDKGNVYCSTKHAVEALTKGMHLDLVKHNIKVTSISPGMVETEFSIVRFKGDKERAKKVYQGFVPLQGKDIAEAVLFVISRPSHVTINDMLIMPAAQKTATEAIKEERHKA